MWFGGFQPFTLSDYPACVAAIAFAQGCNFRCRFCHNTTLLHAPVPGTGLMSDDFVVKELENRRGRLKGLVVSGGEPTLQEDLPHFLSRIKELGYKVKLDTNGSRPGVIQRLLKQELLDYVAMDVKSTMEGYAGLCGVPVSTDDIQASIALIAASGISHHFRTTFGAPFMTEEALTQIKSLIPPGSSHIIQTFKPEFALDPELRGGRPSQ